MPASANSAASTTIAAVEIAGTGAATVVGSSIVLLAGLASPPPETTALFVTVPGTPGLTVNVMSLAPPELSTTLLVQVTVCPDAEQDQPPAGPVADTYVNPAGSVSVTL